MQWNVWYYECNSKKIKVYDVLRNRKDTIKKMANTAISYEEFVDKLRREMKYYYWSKFEWEMTLGSYGGLTDGSEEIRIDVWDQLNLNWDRFAEYCWNESREDR